MKSGLINTDGGVWGWAEVITHSVLNQGAHPISAVLVLHHKMLAAKHNQTALSNATAPVLLLLPLIPPATAMPAPDQPHRLMIAARLIPGEPAPFNVMVPVVAPMGQLRRTVLVRRHQLVFPLILLR